MTDEEARQLLALALINAQLDAHDSGELQGFLQEQRALAAWGQVPGIGERLSRLLGAADSPEEVRRSARARDDPRDETGTRPRPIPES
jgi:hypothetical protein